MQKHYTRNDEPFTLDDKTFMDLYDEGIDYFNTDVLPLYTDTVINDPMEGIRLAFSDFLTNDSPLQDESGRYLPWEDAIALGRQLYDLSHLDNDAAKRLGSGELRPLSKTKRNPKQNSLHEVCDWLQEMIDDGSPENERYAAIDKDDHLFRALLRNVDEVDLDKETMDAADNDFWNRWFSIRNEIIRKLADEVIGKEAKR